MIIPEAVIIALGAGTLGWFGKVCERAYRTRESRHSVDRKFDSELEQHWTRTTLELVDTLREELTEAKKELANLRPMEARLAHLEEALDHIHALLSSDTDAERTAAERRAQAFMRRMRGDDRKGDTRNTVQTEISKRRIIRDSEGRHN